MKKMALSHGEMVIVCYGVRSFSITRLMLFGVCAGVTDFIVQINLITNR